MATPDESSPAFVDPARVVDRLLDELRELLGPVAKWMTDRDAEHLLTVREASEVLQAMQLAETALSEFIYRLEAKQVPDGD